jgi:hypothetical protein
MASMHTASNCDTVSLGLKRRGLRTRLATSSATAPTKAVCVRNK